MSFYVFCGILLGIAIVIYLWYLYSSIKRINDNDVLSLNSDIDMILTPWFISQTKNKRYGSQLNLEQFEDLPSMLLKQLFNIDGKDKAQIIKYNGGKYNLRDIIGINAEIVLNENYNDESIFDTSLIKDIVDENLIDIGKEYLEKVLAHRWEKINNLNDPNVINNSGSYLYLKECNIPNVISEKTNQGYRINLLCSDLEFGALIKRWEAFVPILMI